MIIPKEPVGPIVDNALPWLWIIIFFVAFLFAYIFGDE